ncbi:MAG: hypothetical protein O2954_04530 [bacterium]|nr:hypothetical protein [bacterium]
MADSPRADALYREALENALSEVQGLTSEIEHTQTLLATLVRRKKAVEGICQAIQSWVDATEDEAFDDTDPLDAFPNLKNAIALTQEEVSLLTSSGSVR